MRTPSEQDYDAVNPQPIPTPELASRRPRSRLSPGLLLASPANLLIFLVIIFPFLYVIVLSFFNETTGTFVGTANFQALFNSTDFWPALLVTVVWTVSNLVLQTIGGIGLALLLFRRFAGREVIRTLFLIPFIVPTAVVALMWRWILNSSYGVLNFALLNVGIIEQPIDFLGNANFALWTLVAINVWRWVPLVGLVVFAVLQTIPRCEYEAAKVEGAGILSTFRHVTYPYLGTSMAALGLLGTLLVSNVFDVIWLLTGGGPLNKTQSLSVYIYQLGFARQDLGGAAAASVVLFVILAVFTLLYFQRRSFRRAQ